MAHRQKAKAVIESLGEEIVRIITPVSICMALVVILVSVLSSNSSELVVVNSMANVAYSETSTDSLWIKIGGAILNSLVFIGVVTVATFFLVFLFYYRCTSCLKYYTGFSSFLVLASMGGEVSLFIISKFELPIDAFTFTLILVNFSVVGALAVYMSNFPILLTQGFLVAIAVLVAYWFTFLPEWTTWVLLIAMAIYDIAAVLLPIGPLKLLVELAITRDEDIPALVYEARPLINEESGQQVRRGWKSRSNVEDSSNVAAVEVSVPLIESRNNVEDSSAVANVQVSAPLIESRSNAEDVMMEGVGMSGAIKLGLGDFIFYSVLVGRAAMYDYMTVYACYLAIMGGLGVTLMLLAVYKKALPALPFSIALGVVFYLLTRLMLEVFVVQCSLSLVMF